MSNVSSFKFDIEHAPLDMKKITEILLKIANGERS